MKNNLAKYKIWVSGEGGGVDFFYELKWELDLIYIGKWGL